MMDGSEKTIPSPLSTKTGCKPSTQRAEESSIGMVSGIQIANVYMRKPKSTSSIFMIKYPTSNMFGKSPILSRRATEMIANFVLPVSACKANKSFKAEIVVVDQLGNEHHVKNITFNPFPN